MSTYYTCASFSILLYLFYSPIKKHQLGSFKVLLRVATLGLHLYIISFMVTYYSLLQSIQKHSSVNTNENELLSYVLLLLIILCCFMLLHREHFQETTRRVYSIVQVQSMSTVSDIYLTERLQYRFLLGQN